MNSLLSWPGWWKRLPWYGLVLAAVCLGLGEWFPFSNFPMYSRNAVETSCLFITDDAGKILFTRPNFGIASFQLNKVYAKGIREMKDRGEIRRSTDLSPSQQEAVGLEVLAWLRERFIKEGHPSFHQRLQLHRRTFYLRHGRVAEEQEKIAEN